MNVTCLLIGSHKYSSDKIIDIPFCRNDLEKLNETLKVNLGIPEERIHIVGLKDDQGAKRSNILRLINNSEALSNDADLLMIYYTGHGVTVNNQSYFLPYDTEPDILSDTAIPITRVQEEFKKITVPNKLFIIDSCFSGVTFGKALSNSKDFSNYLESLKGVGWTIFSSCKGDEFAWFYEEKELSVFTYYLIDGLKGNALKNVDKKQLTFEDLYLYVSRKVAEWAVNDGKSQTPTIRTEKAGTIILQLEKINKTKVSAEKIQNKIPSALNIVLTSIYRASTGFSTYEINADGGMIFDNISYTPKTKWHSYSDDERLNIRDEELLKTLKAFQAKLLLHILPSQIEKVEEDKIKFPFGILHIDEPDDFSFKMTLYIKGEDVKEDNTKIFNDIDNQDTIIWNSISYNYSNIFDFDEISKVVREKGYRIVEYDVFENKMVVNVTPTEKESITMTFSNKDDTGDIIIEEKEELRKDFFEVVPIREMIEIFNKTFIK